MAWWDSPKSYILADRVAAYIDRQTRLGLDAPSPTVALLELLQKVEQEDCSHKWHAPSDKEALSGSAARSHLSRPPTPGSQSGVEIARVACRFPKSYWEEKLRTCAMLGQQDGLLDLPSEIVDQILSLLSPHDLATVAQTCRRLHALSYREAFWQRHVQDNVPGCKVQLPYDIHSSLTTFRELYGAHDPFWFLPKYKVWFSDAPRTGMLVIVRFDPRRGCIEGHRLVCERGNAGPPVPWDMDPTVFMSPFKPRVRLHTDVPVLKLEPYARAYRLRSSSRFADEYNLPVDERLRSRIFLTRSVKEHPAMDLWPPIHIPAHERVRNNSPTNFTGSGHRPNTRSEICDQAFRLRRWMDMPGGLSARFGEGVSTFSTLDPYLYTPTVDKPLRGIWVGDYGPHGCEYILMHQPDDETPFDASMIERRADESEASFQFRLWLYRPFRGRLEAIKLTGDPNVPRGEHTFICDDLSSPTRMAEEGSFKNAIIVKSRGHIAERDFENDRWVDAHLLIRDYNTVALWWMELDHINFYRRVNIDDFTDPYEDLSATSGGIPPE